MPVGVVPHLLDVSVQEEQAWSTAVSRPHGSCLPSLKQTHQEVLMREHTSGNTRVEHSSFERMFDGCTPTSK
eukprot:1153288-Pelagomonas_calceolata.AAC.2